MVVNYEIEVAAKNEQDAEQVVKDVKDEIVATIETDPKERNIFTGEIIEASSSNGQYKTKLT